MGNIKIRNLEDALTTEVTSGNFLAMALNPEEGHERSTRKINLEQIVSGGAVYADFSEGLKISGENVLTGFEIPGGGEVIGGDASNINFGSTQENDDRDINIQQNGETKISIGGDKITIGAPGDGVNPSTETIEIINDTFFEKKVNFVTPENVLFGEAPNTQTLTQLLEGVSIDSISDIGDVSNTTPLDGQVLKWNDGAWAPAADDAGTTIGGLNDIGDVTITSVNNGDALVYNGTRWVNSQPDEASLFVSDASLKNDVSQISSAIEKIQSIRGVNFTWNDKAPKELPGSEDIGVIAQEVQSIAPSAVSEKDGLLHVQYHKIIPLLIEAIKQQQKEINDLKSKINQD
jgi:hypothetical protein